MKSTIFYGWQSDTRAAANRTLIQDALETAVKDLRNDGSLSVEPVVDRDTLAVPGAPDIGATILEKIDASAAVVADVTIVGRDNNRPTPNPNVLIELGYALKSLGLKRIIMVQNTAFGGPEDLPFDLRQKRVLTYNSPKDAPDRASERRQLRAKLKEALALVLADAPQSATPYPVTLTLERMDKNIRSERHDYQLRVNLKNNGTTPITEWHVDVKIPTRLLENPSSNYLRVAERSGAEHTFLRVTHVTRRSTIYPGDTLLALTVDYRVDDALYRDLRGLFDQKVTATAYVHGDLAATAECVVRDLQKL